MKRNKNHSQLHEISRREFLQELSFTAFTVSPILSGLLSHRLANAAVLTAPVSPIVHLHLSGGWGHHGTFVGGLASGAMISRTTMNAHGIASGFGNPTPGAGILTNFGAPIYDGTISAFTAGLLASLSPEAQANVRIVNVMCRSKNDSDDVNYGLLPMISKLGSVGRIGSTAGFSNSESGNGVNPLISDPAAQRLVVGKMSDIISAAAFSKTLAAHGQGLLEKLSRSMVDLANARVRSRSRNEREKQFSDVMKGSFQEASARVNPTNGTAAADLNPKRDASVQVPFGLTATTDPNEETSNGFLNSSDVTLRQAAMTKAVLDGNLSAVAFRLDGYDYHQVAQSTTNPTNNRAGTLVGRILQAAHNKQKPVGIFLTTDGGLSANGAFNTTDPSSPQFSGDREEFSGSAYIFYAPSGSPGQKSKQLGAVDPMNGQVLGNTPVGTDRLATAAVFYNHLLLTGNRSAAEELLELAGFSRQEIDAIRAMPAIFQL